MKIVSEINSIAKLTRAGNLVIIALSLFLVRYLVVKPFLFLDNTESSISDFQFSLLTLAVVLIAAGGYVINDIFEMCIRDRSCTGIFNVDGIGSNHSWL